MNLQDYIEQIKGWIVRQCFLIRHYRIVIFIFFILALAMIAAGIFILTKMNISILIQHNQRILLIIKGR